PIAFLTTINTLATWTEHSEQRGKATWVYPDLPAWEVPATALDANALLPDPMTDDSLERYRARLAKQTAPFWDARMRELHAFVACAFERSTRGRVNAGWCL